LNINALWKEAKNKVETDYKVKKIKKKDIDSIEYLNEFVSKLYENANIQNQIYNVDTLIDGE